MTENQNLQKKLSSENKESKYGDDELFESWADVNIFVPLGIKLVDPLYQIGMTPNMVTIMSTIFTFLSIYFLHSNKNILAACSYLVGYIFDCVDGRMARKYSMTSDIGMALDAVSDNVSNIILFIFIMSTRSINLPKGLLLGFVGLMSFLLSVSFGLNEAIASKKSIGSDNFYERRVKQLKQLDITNPLEKILYQLYLFITNSSYKTYKMFFPIYNETKMFKWLKILKHFGPGNFILVVTILLLVV